MNSNSINSIHGDVLKWLESVRYPDEGWGRWKYSKGMVRPYGLIATRLALSIYDQLDALPSISPEQKQEGIAFLQSCQDTDGFFKDPLVSDKDLAMGHSYVKEDFWVQMDATGALRQLGAKPLYGPPTKVHSNLQGEEGMDWLRGLDWSNPWLNGERFSRAVSAVCGGVYAWSSKTPAGEETADPEQAKRMASLEELFRFMETKVMSPSTGLPDAGGCHHPDVAMAGLFKLLFAYIDAKRPFPYATAAIDSILELQSDAGDFAQRPDLPKPDGSTYVIRYERDMCINWDALWTLRQLDKETGRSHRHGDIVRAAERLSECLLRDYRKPDGGFAFAADHCLLIHQAMKISKPLPESDIVGTFMCLECLRYTNEWISEAR
jgi:hypothetical protein